MPVTIGDLKHRLELIDAQRADDDVGGFTRDDTVAGTVWAAIRPASWREQQASEQLAQRISYVATVRFNAEIRIKQGMRARWRDRAGVTHECRIETAQDPDLSGRFVELGLAEGGPL